MGTSQTLRKLRNWSIGPRTAFSTGIPGQLRQTTWTYIVKNLSKPIQNLRLFLGQTSDPVLGRRIVYTWVDEQSVHRPKNFLDIPKNFLEILENF